MAGDAAASSSGGAAAAAPPQQRPRVELLVDAGDEGAAALLLRCMYQGAAALAGVAQAQLVAVLRLADRFAVTPAMVAVASHLAT